MDLNGDGAIDLLSGSYSRMEQDMAGLFQVLWGSKAGTFAAAKVLLGTDEQPLIIAADKDHVTDKICTRPTAVDLDGDGKLDIVAGNFSGTFAFFRGEGNGRFEPKNSWLMANGSPIRVPSHGDPCFVDWDGDGDFDLISGSSAGGVFLFENLGSAKKAEFGQKVTLLPANRGDADVTHWGDAQLTGPQSDTRVFVADVNGDGKLDLLVGDAVALSYPAAGLDAATAKAKLADWQKQEKRVMSAQTGGSEEAQKQFQEAYATLQKQRDAIVRTDRTGFVWVIHQK